MVEKGLNSIAFAFTDNLWKKNEILTRNVVEWLFVSLGDDRWSRIGTHLNKELSINLKLDPQLPSL